MWLVERSIAGLWTSRVDDLLQVRRVARDHARDDVVRAGDSVGLEYLGDGVECLDRLLEAALREVEQHQREDRIPHRLRLDLGPIARDDAPLLELRQAGLHGPTRHLEAARDLE